MCTEGASEFLGAVLEMHISGKVSSKKCKINMICNNSVRLYTIHTVCTVKVPHKLTNSMTCVINKYD